MIKKEFLRMRVADLVPYENNPRVITAAAIDAVVESMNQREDLAPIELDEYNVILGGHTRRLAHIKRGDEFCDVVRYTGLSEEQKQKYRLLANKTGEIAQWDFDKLDEELANLDFGGFDFGFDIEEPKKKVVEDNYDEPAPTNPQSKLGQVWQLGRHRLMVGDSTSIEDVSRLMDDRQADMLLTDPPYNVNYHSEAGTIQNDNMGDPEFRQFLRDAFANARAVMKPGAAFHIWHADSEGYNFRGACYDVGLKIRQCLIWVKNSLVLGRSDFQWKHEPCLFGENPLESGTAEYEDDDHQPCLYGWKDGRHYWFKNRKQTTILQFDKPLKSAEHPTMKPVLMFDYEMQCNSKPGEIVLDLFGGSGTTVIAAEQNDRIAYVMEYDPKYADVIIDRWEKFTGETAVLLDD